MIKIPPYLQIGDTIAIVCPAGFMPFEKAAVCIDTLGKWGYKVKTGATLGGASPNYFSGTDEERLQDLQQMLDDSEVKAILCGRGGYGLTHIIDTIDFSRFRKKPKWIIGFSDITVLHAHIHTNYKIATLHAPMAAAFNEGGADGPYVGALRAALEGKPSQYTCAVHPLNRIGEASGELVGGNLSLLAHLSGTDSELKTKGKILFLEDVGEYIYNVDRLLYQLKRNGRLDHLAGLLIGGFTEMKDTQRPFGKPVYEAIQDVIAEYEYPVSFHFPVSHEKENYTLKVGVEHTLKVEQQTVSLTEKVS